MSPLPSSSGFSARRIASCVASVLVIGGLGLPSVVVAQPVVTPPFAADYTITDLGSVAGVPANYGGLT